MGRPLRIELEDGLYHVIVRGNDRRSVFRDDADRQRYLGRLAFYAEKYSFRAVAYCLMDNHVHLAIERGDVPLAKIMAGLQSSYTQYFNRRHGRSGHLFQGRYKAFLVEKGPVRVGPASLHSREPGEGTGRGHLRRGSWRGAVTATNHEFRKEPGDSLAPQGTK
jgi:REP element-mobilizing transposase RayT